MIMLLVKRLVSILSVLVDGGRPPTLTTTPVTVPSCDESKCQATRPHNWVDNDVEYTCWVPRGANATELLCADEYEGRTVPASESIADGGADDGMEWYTCCPPNYEGEIVRQCSDAACSSPDWKGTGNCWADGFQDPETCGSPEFRYPRYTGAKASIYRQYLCCTTKEDDPRLLAARVVWSVLSGITFLACTVFVGGIASSPSARAQGYNLYLVFLAIPDSIANLIVLIRNIITITGAPVRPTAHIFFASVEYFYASSNMWLNAVIVRQIHVLLLKTQRAARVQPPSVQDVRRQAGAVYVWAAAWFGWAFALYYRGLVWFTQKQVFNVWIVTRCVMVGPPLFYVLFVSWDVWRKKLLPRSGRTRVIAIYFLRVVVVFLVTWVPYFILYEIAFNVTNSRVMVQISYLIGSLQGLVSMVVAMSKPDVKRAVFNFVQCRGENAPETPQMTRNVGVRDIFRQMRGGSKPETLAGTEATSILIEHDND